MCGACPVWGSCLGGAYFSRNECENMHEKLSAWEACFKTQSPGFFLGTDPWHCCRPPEGRMRSINHVAIPMTMGGAAPVGLEGCGGDTGGLPSAGMGTGRPHQQTVPGLLCWLCSARLSGSTSLGVWPSLWKEQAGNTAAAFWSVNRAWKKAWSSMQSMKESVFFDLCIKLVITNFQNLKEKGFAQDSML